MAIFRGTKHDDALTGTTGDDTFDLFKGGNDTASGGDGDDLFKMGASLNAGDRLDGGADRDAVLLNGDYSAGLVFDDLTIQNIEVLRFGKGFDYKLTMADGNVAARETLTINASQLGAGNHLTFDGSAENDGHFAVYGGAGNDTLTGGAKADVFHLETGGNDTVHGGGGNDTIVMGAAFTSADVIDGGSGNDTLSFNTNGGITLSDSAVTNVETLVFGAHRNYTATVTGDLAGGSTLNVDASDAARLTLDLTAATSAAYAITAGLTFTHINFGSTFSGADTITGAADTQLNLDGDYAGTIAFSDTRLTGIRTINLLGDHSYAVSVIGDIGSSGHLTSIGASPTATHTDVIDLTQATGTYEVVDSGAGSTTVKFAGNFTSSEFIAGANTTVELAGDYSAGLHFTATFAGTGSHINTLTGVGTLKLDDGFSYKLSMDEDNNGVTLTVDASALTGTNKLTFDTTADPGSNAFAITGGAGDDAVKFAGNFVASDTFNGGAGSDTLSFDGAYASLALSGTKIANIETLAFTGAHAYTGVAVTGDIAGGSTLSIDASTANSLSIDLSAATSADYAITGSGGDDTVVFGQNIANVNQGDVHHFTTTDTFDGGAGDDMLEFKFNNAGVFLTFQADTIANVDTLKLDGTFTLTLNDANVAAGETLTVWASVELGSGSTVDGSAETDGAFHFIGEQSQGQDIFKGGAGNDLFDMRDNDSVSMLTGNGGNDTFSFNTRFNFVRAMVSGDSGSDTLELNGDYTALALRGDADHITSVETLKLSGGHSYTGASITGDMAGGSTLAIDASAASNISIDLSAATSAAYAITGSGGADTFKFGGNFSVSDSIDGGAGNDTATLNNVSGVFTFTASTIANVETLDIVTGRSVNIYTNDANVAAGATLTVDYSLSNSVHADILFDGSAETDGHFNIVAPSNPLNLLSFTVTGGALSDTFTLGNDEIPDNAINGAGGDDTLTMTTTDVGFAFNGGSGNDTLVLTGGGAFGANVMRLTSVETMTLDDHTWNITTGDQAINVSGATLTVDATALSGSHTLAFNGSGETDGSFVFKFTGNLTASDSLTGGAGSDTLSLDGDYTGGVTFSASTISGIETIVLAAGHGYGFTTNDANVAAGATLTVDASALGSGDQLFFGGGNETNGHFAFIGGAGADVLSGGKLSDTFDLSRSDGAFVSGFDGNDTFTLTTRAHLLDDSVDGGSGSDTLVLNGDFSTQTALTAANLTSIETVQLQGGANSYNLSVFDGIATSLNVDASGANSLTLDGSGASTTDITVNGSNGDDHVTGGGGNDILFGSGGQDILTGGGNEDDFAFFDTGDSTTASLDTITDFTANTDIIQFIFGVTMSFQGEFNSAAATGTLDGDLAAAFNNQGGGVHSAYVIDFTGADFAGRSFLVTDSNGNGQYDAGIDFVVDMTGHIGTITSSDFI